MDTAQTLAPTADAVALAAPAVVEAAVAPAADSGWWAITED